MSLILNKTRVRVYLLSVCKKMCAFRAFFCKNRNALEAHTDAATNERARRAMPFDLVVRRAR